MTKIKACIHAQEWFPVLELSFDENDYEFRHATKFVHLSQNDIDKYCQIMQEFDDLQEKLHDLRAKT